jgi:hypothetical protein
MIFYWTPTSPIDAMFFTIVLFMDYFSIGGWALFCILGWILQLHVHLIIKDIDRLKLPPNEEWTKTVDDRFRVWRRQYGSANECIHLLNEAFGVILFTHTTTIFIAVISQTFFMAVAFLESAEVEFMPILTVTEKCALLWITCSISDMIHSQVCI